jgi:hypothetical protein
MTEPNGNHLTEFACKQLIKNAQKFIKLPIPVKMIQLAESFTLTTPEGVQTATAGSWLAEDANGGFYPISDDVKMKTYRGYRQRKTKKAKVGDHNDDLAGGKP